MSKLLISEEPLQVLPSLAVAVGLNEAIFLQQVHYWLNRSKHVHDGRVWVYNTREEWLRQFPFWSLSTLKRTVTSLRDQGLLLTTNAYNTMAVDNTLWYSIDYEALESVSRPVVQNEPMDGFKLSRPVVQNEPLDRLNLNQPITKRIPENTTETNTEKEEEKEPTAATGSPTRLSGEVFDAWHKNVPGTMTPILADKLHDLIEECGVPSVIHGIEACVMAGARNFSYVAKCARNHAQGKQAPTTQLSAPQAKPTTNYLPAIKSDRTSQAFANVRGMIERGDLSV